jgi:hypothetical protein
MQKALMNIHQGLLHYILQSCNLIAVKNEFSSFLVSFGYHVHIL